MQQIHPPYTVTVKAAAGIAGLSTWQMKKLCEAGLIESVFDGPTRLVKVDSLMAWLEGLPVERPSGGAA